MQVRCYSARALASLGILLALAMFSTSAHAAGSFKLKTTSVNEVGGAWHIFVKVELPRAPALAHVPMRFLFTKEAVFERALVDGHGDEPVKNQFNLQNQTPSVESLDVDFADGSGKVFKGTNFDFALTRDRGYEAGIYKVEVRTSDGITLGGSQRLTMNGDNPVVDRRAITFNAKDPSVKKVAAYGNDAGANGAPQADDTPVQSSEVAPSGSAAPFIPPDAYNKQPEEEVKTHPSGCGCTVVGANASANESGLAAAGALAIGLAVTSRSRKRRR